MDCFGGLSDGAVEDAIKHNFTNVTVLDASLRRTYTLQVRTRPTEAVAAPDPVSANSHTTTTNTHVPTRSSSRAASTRWLTSR